MFMKPKKSLFNHTLFFLIFLLSTGLLIGKTFETSWSGGTGYVPQEKIVVKALTGTALKETQQKKKEIQEGDVLTRGEKILTQANSKLFLETSSGLQIALDENAQIILTSLLPHKTSFFVSKGRVYANTGCKKGTSCSRSLELTTNYSNHIVTQGAFSLVNYDFLQKVRVIPFENIVSLFLKPNYHLQTDHPLEINEAFLISITKEDHGTLPSYEEFIESVDFDPNQDLIKDFYQWVNERL